MDTVNYTEGEKNEISNGLCKICNEKASCLCEICKKALCSKCAVKHKGKEGGHAIIYIEMEAMSKKAQLEEEAEKILKDQGEGSTDAIKILDEMVKGIKSMVVYFENEILRAITAFRKKYLSQGYKKNLKDLLKEAEKFESQKDFFKLYFHCLQIKENMKLSADKSKAKISYDELNDEFKRIGKEWIMNVDKLILKENIISGYGKYKCKIIEKILKECADKDNEIKAKNLEISTLNSKMKR